MAVEKDDMSEQVNDKEMSPVEDAGSKSSAGATLLFVDDEANILSSLRRLFRPLGYNILLANNGREGLSVLEDNAVDLIVSDMRMPEMDGAEFLAQAAKKSPDTVRILLTGYADMESTIAAINKGKIYQYFSKPWVDTEITLGVKHALEQHFLKQERDRLLVLTSEQNKELQSLNASLEEKVKERTRELKHTMDMLEEAHGSLKKSFTSSIKVLSNIIEMRESTLPGHSRRVAELASVLAKKANVKAESVQQILFAALLHKIGTIGMPDGLLKKPYEAMTEDEFAQYAKHPVIGEGMLLVFENLNEAATIIRGQHERYDGKGFPDKLSAQQIPIGSRILAIVIDYELFQAGTITTQRQSESDALQFLINNRKTRYDPDLVMMFKEIIHSEIQMKLDEKIRMKLVSCNNLIPGMVLAQDVMLKGKVLLLSMGRVLDKHTIQRLLKLERTIDGTLDVYVVSAE